MNSTHAIPVISLMLVLAPAVDAQDIPVTPNNVTAVERPYSPYAGRAFPTMVLWGDTHLHTSNSLDARAVGATLGPEEAFRPRR